MASLAWPWLVLLTLLAAGVIVTTGIRLCALADTISDRSGLSKTLIGAVLLGAVTSLPGIAASVGAALGDQPALAASNAVGGIAAQTAFLAVADFCYKRANLEHDAATIDNILQAGLMVAVLTLPVAAAVLPMASDWAVHPVTPLLIIAYLLGLRMVQSSSEKPMWVARGGDISGVDLVAQGPEAMHTATALTIRFLIHAVLVTASGWLLVLLAEAAHSRFGISQAALGGLGTGVITSLPELIVTITAVRRGALSLAIGGVLGGNAFDALFLAAADIAWLKGSIYHALPAAGLFQLTISCTMAAVLLLGLTTRQRSGPANVGIEGIVVLALYLLSAVALGVS